MLKYLDVNTFLFSELDWSDFSFLSRFEDFMKFLAMLKEYESERDKLYKIFQFSMSPDINNIVWEENPFINTPTRNIHYKNIFTSSIWPDLLRRMVECPTELNGCLASAVKNLSVPALCRAPTSFESNFHSHISVCACCSYQGDRVFYFHPAKLSIILPDNFFCRAIDITDKDPRLGLESIEIWPNPRDHKNRDKSMMDSIECRLSELKMKDPNWNDFSLSPISFSVNFWRTIHHGNFGIYEKEYKTRILDVLVQLSTRRKIDISEHDMNTETIKIDGVDHGKWNSHVFKMGPNAQDRRCSRLYYAKANGGFYINEYNPDAH